MVFTRRAELTAARWWLCMLRGDGGCMVWNCEFSNLGDSGEVGRIAGEERGEGILGGAVGRVRVGDAALAGAAVLRT